MRKTLSLLLALVMLLGLFTGCDEEEAPTEIATRPTVTAEPEETTVPEDAVEETEVPEEGSLHTAVLRAGDPELQAEYILLAVNPEGPFLSEVSLNEDGANALIRWFATEQVRAKLENFGVEEYGEPVFTLAEGKPFQGWIPNAAEENKTIRLSVADTLVESGILDQLLPIFEETYGYTVDVQSTSASGTLTAAKLGIMDLVLTEQSSVTEAFIADGYARKVDGFESEAISFCGLEYLLSAQKMTPQRLRTQKPCRMHLLPSLMGHISSFPGGMTPPSTSWNRASGLPVRNLVCGIWKSIRKWAPCW